MYKIAICDDDKDYLNTVCELVRQIADKNAIEVSINLYADGQSLKNDIYNANVEFNLILFDIMLKEDNGIKIACELRKINSDVGIIFISTSSDFLLDGYDAEPTGYVLKPIDKSKLENAILRAYKKHGKNTILIKDNDENISILLSDIIYVDVYGKDLTFHLKQNRTITLKRTLGEIINILPKNNFAQCHRSYIAAISSIISIKRYELKMTENNILPISKRYYMLIQQAIIENTSAKV